MSKRKKKEYQKHRKSKKYLALNRQFKEKIKKEKHNYYANVVQDLKMSNPKKWYEKLKRLSKVDPHEEDEIKCEEIQTLSDQEQVEALADQYENVASQYQPLRDEDITLPHFSPDSIPSITPSEAFKYLDNIKTNTSTVKNDMPAKLVKRFAKHLCIPFSHIMNSQFSQGQYADLWKIENVTPVPKTSPVKFKKDLRKISIFSNFSKISEKIVSDLVIEDMVKNLEKSQYGNQKGLSINHYLINMLNMI